MRRIGGLDMNYYQACELEHFGMTSGCLNTHRALYGMSGRGISRSPLLLVMIWLPLFPPDVSDIGSKVSVATPANPCAAEAAASQLQRTAPGESAPASGKIALPSPGLSLRSKTRKTPPLETIAEQARAAETSAAAAGVPEEKSDTARDAVAAGSR